MILRDQRLDDHRTSMILRDQNCSCRDVEANWMIFRDKNITAKRWDFGNLWNICKFVVFCVDMFLKTFFATACKSCTKRNHFNA